jgi:hypothetical protein
LLVIAEVPNIRASHCHSRQAQQKSTLNDSNDPVSLCIVPSHSVSMTSAGTDVKPSTVQWQCLFKCGPMLMQN